MKKKRARGRPTKYKPGYVTQVEKLCALGATDMEMADFFEVNLATFHRWKLEHADFCDAIKDAKDVADKRVVRSLYQRACGYSHPDVHISNYQGMVKATPIIKHYPPDATSCIFWLKNRQPEDWRDRVEHTGKDGADLIPPMDDYELARRIGLVLQRATQGVTLN